MVIPSPVTPSLTFPLPHLQKSALCFHNFPFAELCCITLLYQGNHVMFTSLCLNFFTHYQGLEFHSASCNDIIASSLVTEDSYAPTFVHPSICSWASRLLSAPGSWAAMMGLQVSRRCRGALLSYRPCAVHLGSSPSQCRQEPWLCFAWKLCFTWHFPDDFRAPVWPSRGSS